MKYVFNLFYLYTDGTGDRREPRSASSAQPVIDRAAMQIGALLAASRRIALGKHPENLDAYECVLRALSLLYTFNDREFAEAGRYLQRAVTLDATYSKVTIGLPYTCDLATLNVELPSQTGQTIQGKPKKIAQVTVRVASS